MIHPQRQRPARTDEEDDFHTELFDHSSRDGDSGRNDGVEFQQELQQETTLVDSRRQRVRWLVAIGLISCIIYVLIDFYGDRKIETMLSMFLEWVQNNPYRGIFLIIILYIMATVFFRPWFYTNIWSRFCYRISSSKFFRRRAFSDFFYLYRSFNWFDLLISVG